MNAYKVITIKLKARTAVHVGSGQARDYSDALIRRDSQGNPIIPGSAVAGALRALLTRLAPGLQLGDDPAQACVRLTNPNSSTECHCPVCQLFGTTNPQDEANSQSHASRLLISHAVLVKDALKATMIRDGVGINRGTGTAARHIKYDMEVLPVGSEFELRMELRNTSPKDDALLAAGLAEWKAGRAWLGGRVSRGLGAFDVAKDTTKDVTKLEYKTHPLETGSDLVTFLKHDRPWQLAKVKPVGNKDWLTAKLDEIQPAARMNDDPNENYTVRTWLKIEGALQAQGPFLTHDATSADTTGFDHAPLLAKNGDWQSPILSGASLRGVLRSHAERIARTLATHHAAKEGDPEKWFAENCPACSPVTRQKADFLASCDTLLKEANVPTDDEVKDVQLCLACRLFGSERRGSRLIIEDARYDTSRGKPKLKMLDFLAIDRFTGGGADAFKFDALVLWRPAFKVKIFIENPSPWELGWLFLTLRDLQTGWLRVGMGAAKGFGEVKMDDPTITLGYLHDTDLEPLKISEKGEKNGSVYQELSISPQQSWVDDFLEMEVTREKGNGNLHPIKDSYFGQVDHLYPVKPQESGK